MAILTDRFEKALQLAFRLHQNQYRKAGGKNRPYFTHLMAVASYVLEVDGTEDDAIVAILHDSIEDQLDRLVTEAKSAGIGLGSDDHRAIAVAYLTTLFGLVVANNIERLSDEKLPREWKSMPKEWRQQWIRESVTKKAAKLATESASVRLVKAADVLHNTRSILQDRTENGPAVWRAFALGAEGTIWKAETMTRVFEEHGPEIIAIELRRVVDRIKEVVAAGNDLGLKVSK